MLVASIPVAVASGAPARRSGRSRRPAAAAALLPAAVLVSAALLLPGSQAQAQALIVDDRAELHREKAIAERRGTARGPVYTWDDGGRTRRAYLQEDLIVAADGAIASSGVEVAATPAGRIVRVGAASRADGLPVFSSPSGALMTLPGGVLLVFVPQWDRSQTDAFLANHGIAMDRVSPLGEIPNGFVVDTEPGFPSLDLAKSLAGQDGVRLSSPNWWTERAKK